jgi:glycosyltransferase involved in cell wall biosynthesis
MMKILVFNWQDIKNPLAGGAEVNLQEVFSRIARMGHEVTLFCSSFDGAPPVEKIDGITVVRQGGRHFFNFTVPFHYFMRFRSRKYDMVVDDMNKIPFFTPLYIREPLYIITHHLFRKSIFLEAPFPVALYVFLMERLGFALCRWKRAPFIVVSPSTRNEILHLGISADNIEIVHNCVDHVVHKADPGKRNPTPLVGYFGRLKKYKSGEHLLQAFAIVRKKFPELNLVFVGEGDYRPALESVAHRLGIDSAVQFTGFVSEAEKVGWMQKVWFGVNTSSKEGWGLTVIEANACGTTVIASDVPGLRDAVKDNETGLLYKFGNIDELAMKIELLLTDTALRNRLAEAAHTWAATFDWDNAAQRTLALLEQRNLQP